MHAILEHLRSPFVESRFVLSPAACAQVQSWRPEFGFQGFGECVYYRTYSRVRADGSQEHWPDTVIRVVQGLLSIRKDWYRRVDRLWDEEKWQDIAFRLARSIFRMQWLPPGRGLYALGTEHVYKFGAMPLFNCGATTTRSSEYTDELAWGMDALMCGVGVGFEVSQEPFHLRQPGRAYTHTVEDSRQGWVDSVRALVLAYTAGAPEPVFNYAKIRKAGTPLKGIGGVASGSAPLQQLHARMAWTFQQALAGKISPLRMRADHANQIGACVTMGDVRRSAEMLIGPVTCPEFSRLKDYNLNPDRAPWGWASNNTLACDTQDDIFQASIVIAGIDAGERPGILNRMAIQADPTEPDALWIKDPATLVNPCGEIPLVSRELCNVVEVVPERCQNDQELVEAVLAATFYASTIALLPTHQQSTNRILYRHRRIGVSLMGAASIFDKHQRWGTVDTEMRQWLRTLRSVVRVENRRLAEEARVTPSIRTTTIKPGGTTPQLAGVNGGMSWGIDTYARRRIRVGQHSPVRKVLEQAGHKPEIDPDSGSLVFSFAIETPGRVERNVPLAEQVELLDVLQTEWADNSVSCTLKHTPHEEITLETTLLAVIPKVKALSVASHQTLSTDYALPPYQALSREQYEEQFRTQPIVDWSTYGGTDGEDLTYCEGPSCSRLDRRDPPKPEGDEEEILP